MQRICEDKIRASVVIIGFQIEDKKMYPHLYDFLKNVRNSFDEVIYLADGDQGQSIFYIDRDIQVIKNFFHKIKNRSNFLQYEDKIKSPFSDKPHIEGFSLPSSRRKVIIYSQNLCFFFYSLWKNIITHIKRHRRLIKNLKHLKMKYKNGLIIAIDQTSFFIANKYYPGKIILWSFDVLTKDYCLRIEGGFLEKIISAIDTSQMKLLIIQDQQRKIILEESLGVTFSKTIYLPVSLDDSEFCIRAAKERMNKTDFQVVKVIQSGHITENRGSIGLINSFQSWPDNFKLTIRGYLDPHINALIEDINRKPDVFEEFYGPHDLSLILDENDIGFIGYGERDTNHKYIVNASAQVVVFLRLGIPIIGMGSQIFCDFINKQKIGVGIITSEEIESAIKKIINNYPSYSDNARNLFRNRYHLQRIFSEYLISDLQKCVDTFI